MLLPVGTWPQFTQPGIYALRLPFAYGTPLDKQVTISVELVTSEQGTFSETVVLDPFGMGLAYTLVEFQFDSSQAVADIGSGDISLKVTILDGSLESSDPTNENIQLCNIELLVGEDLIPFEPAALFP